MSRTSKTASIPEKTGARPIPGRLVLSVPRCEMVRAVQQLGLKPSYSPRNRYNTSLHSSLDVNFSRAWFSGSRSSLCDCNAMA